VAKKSDGTRNFYRFIAVLGILVIASLGYSFISSAPNLNTAPYHKPLPAPSECMKCHITGEEKTPIMPHRPMGTCKACHKPYKSE
tara:strand:- start:99 stop:353 length:255 start_codon:yes stop_codon:yes gene_type:complete